MTTISIGYSQFKDLRIVSVTDANIIPSSSNMVYDILIQISSLRSGSGGFGHAWLTDIIMKK